MSEKSEVQSRLTLVEVTPAIRRYYRQCRGLGVSRREANFMTFGAATATASGTLFVRSIPS